MSFVSLFLNPNDSKVANLIDSEFGKVDIPYYGNTTDELIFLLWKSFIKEYTKRNLPVGKNIALHAIWLNDLIKIPIKETIEHQNEWGSRCENWDRITKERDDYLSKILPLL